MTSHSTRTRPITRPRRITRPRPFTRTRVALAAAACLLAVGAPAAYATFTEDAPTGSVVAPARGTP